MPTMVDTEGYAYYEEEKPKRRVKKKVKRSAPVPKPRTQQGFEVREITQFIPSTFSETGKAYQRNHGLGVSGPNIEETDPKKLRRLASFLLHAANYIESKK